jgi:uncharacterized protein with NRDE domain
MCTVTFIPSTEKVFITHSRDENKLRPAAFAPQVYQHAGTNLLYPRDMAAGGSWIGINNNGNAAVLLNGAYHKHVSSPPYKKSRGLVFLDILSADDMLSFYRSHNLKEIEPFTLVLWNGNDLFECRWDASRKHIHQLKETDAHMWSSSTLYDDAVVRKRQSWFDSWLAGCQDPTAEEIIDFHLHAGEGDPDNDLRMNRQESILTLSITGIEITQRNGKMKYLDLGDHSLTTRDMKFRNTAVENS